MIIKANKLLFVNKYQIYRLIINYYSMYVKLLKNIHIYA